MGRLPDLLRTTADAASPRAAAWVAAVVGAALCATDTLADSPVGVGALDAPTAQAHGAGDTPAREGRRRPFGEVEARLKWQAAARSLPRGDAERQRIGKPTAIEHGADLRLMWKGEAGPLSFNVHHSTVWREGDHPGGASPGPTFDGTPAGDERRLVDLTWHVEADAGRRILHRVDRFAAEYRTARWRIILGREAVTWGGGFFFHPMDLFNPFAPTTIDQDYKPGDDLVRAERLFDGGSELEILAVGRRGERDLGSASLAAKLRGFVGENEFELMASRHYGEPVFGLGLRLPAGGALLRSDVTLARPGDDVVLSGLVNADITFGIGDAPVHIFGEYFHNGFGVSRLPGDLGTLPAPLVERVGRGRRSA